MVKRILLNTLRGAFIGVALQYILAIVISVKLQAGYLMAYVTTLAEAVNGEMNAVILEASLSALLGACFALALTFLTTKAWSWKNRLIAAVISLLSGILPVTIVTISALQFWL